MNEKRKRFLGMQELRAFFCLLALLCLPLAAGCGSEQAVEQKAPLVKSMAVGATDGASSDTYAGTVRGRYETNLSFQVGGQILARNVNVGDRVSAGDVLMVIDAKDVAQKANQGDAAVASAKAQLNLAQSNLARYSELYNEAAVPAAVLDQYQTQYDAAFAAYQNALAEAAQGHNALGYTNLIAGADGVISAAAALVACRICPRARAYILPSHRSRESAARQILSELDLHPVLDAGMALGEGTGAVMLFPLLDMALAVYGSSHTFQNLGMAAYVPLEGK